MHTNQTSNGEIIKFAQHENLNQNFSEKKEKKGKEKKSAKKSNRLALTPHQWKILNKSLFFNKEIINVESILKTSANWSKKMAKSRSRKDSTKKKKKVLTHCREEVTIYMSVVLPPSAHPPPTESTRQ